MAPAWKALNICIIDIIENIFLYKRKPSNFINCEDKINLYWWCEEKIKLELKKEVLTLTT